MKKPLTIKQKNAYEFIYNYIKHKGESPTREEIRDFIKVKSINSVAQYLEVLEKSGYISRTKHGKRSIEIVGDKNENDCFVQIPVVASVGCDNLCVFAEEKTDEFLQVDKKIVKSPNMFAVRAVGDSMNEAGIENGDYVLVDGDVEIKNGDKVVAVIDGMATLKRFEKKENFVVLWPESKDNTYKPIIVDQDFQLAGKVISTVPRPIYDDIEIINEPE